MNKGRGSNFRHPDDVARAKYSRLYMTRRECRDSWYVVARIRESSGDIEGAARARFAARCISGDSRIRHDL